MDSQRTLTEADIEAILAAFEAKFYSNLGKGLWKIVWQSALIAMLAIAGYGAMHR